MAYLVPHRIETERLVLRRFERSDARALATVIQRNLDHLRAYMEWAQFEPQSVAQREQWIAEVNRQFDAGEDYTLGMFTRDGALVGGTGYHRRTEPDRLALGYWIDRDLEGRGLVTEACAALTHVAIRIAGTGIVDISHAPSNGRSAAVPARLGFQRQQGSGQQCYDRGEKHGSVTWFATAATLAAEPLASTPRPRVTDATGTEVPWPSPVVPRGSP
ncbi:GNAT family N-acetyltransferase [Demequina sp. SO4-18]|uniref:GNAT family N-acetyltransferase n=1 Tax=Demequina sp. SO4-18 TaxID=3401026 RepID=UPI003B5B050A